MTDEPLCKGCRQPTHPSYIDRYGGYCLDCDNAGVSERDEQIENLKQENERLAKLAQHKDDTLKAWVKNMEEPVIRAMGEYWERAKRQVNDGGNYGWTSVLHVAAELMRDEIESLEDDLRIYSGNLYPLTYRESVEKVLLLSKTNKKLQEALELYALEENWSDEGEYTYSTGSINSNGGEDEYTRIITLDSRTVFVGNQMGDDEGWKIAQEAIEKTMPYVRPPEI